MTEASRLDPRGFDSLLPRAIARKAEELGVQKVSLGASTTFLLSVLAGAFIAVGALFATTVIAGSAPFLGFGPTRLLGGLAFSTGLVLVVVAGAELFTGNNLIVMSWASRRIRFHDLLENWGLVYVGNLAGALLTALLVFAAGQFEVGGGIVGTVALSTANAKVELSFLEAFTRGVLCNALVCLAVWLALSGRSTTDKILAIIFPITAFVAAGFEHCVANMYFIPYALLIKSGAGEAFWQTIGKTPADFSSLTGTTFLVRNLLPVTLGNILGGSLLVGGIYWFAYLRGERARDTTPPRREGSGERGS
jgi:formate/nitrite transporter